MPETTLDVGQPLLAMNQIGPLLGMIDDETLDFALDQLPTFFADH